MLGEQPHLLPLAAKLLVAGWLAKPAVTAMEIGALVRYERPQPTMSSYDQLLGKAVQA